MPSSEVFRNTFVSGLSGASLVAQMVKHLPAMQEPQVQSLGQEDPLEKGMATHSSILAWRTPWTERVRLDWATNTLAFLKLSPLVDL